MNHLPLLRIAIRETFGCDSMHIATHRVNTEIGSVMWSGHVEQFTLTGYPYAEHVFGWMWATNSKTEKPCVVLKMWPVETPEGAVLAAFDREFYAHADRCERAGREKVKIGQSTPFWPCP